VEALLLSLTVTGPIGVEDLAQRFPVGPEISIHYRRCIFWATPRATALVAQGPYPPLSGQILMLCVSGFLFVKSNRQIMK